MERIQENGRGEIMDQVQDFENTEDLNEWLAHKNPKYWIIKKIFSRPDHTFFVWYDVKPFEPE